LQFVDVDFMRFEIGERIARSDGATIVSVAHSSENEEAESETRVGQA
jgi:hypothetical protein